VSADPDSRNPHARKPVAGQPVTGQPVGPAGPAADATAAGLAGSRDIVLIVDDSPDTLGFLSEALEGAGLTVLVAVNGENALELTQRITPDLILLDAVMPGLGGFETCRQLKQRADLMHVPVIFMTGLSETEHIVRGLEAGGVDYLTKPVMVEELMARMRVHLVNARRGQTAQVALDAAGRFLLSVGDDGRIGWSTPQATKLLQRFFSHGDGGVLPPAVCEWLLHPTGGRRDAPSFNLTVGEAQLEFAYLGRIRQSETLLRLSMIEPASEIDRLRRQLALTAREAEVLIWLARGKANKDISEILSISPRTVNKHLEQVYEKLGVENRASATAIALDHLRRL